MAAITKSQLDVTAYRYDEASGTLIYATVAPTDRDEQSRRDLHGFVVENGTIQDLAGTAGRGSNYFYVSVNGGVSVRLDLPSILDPRSIALAPGGRWAAVAEDQPTVLDRAGEEPDTKRLAVFDLRAAKPTKLDIQPVTLKSAARLPAVWSASGNVLWIEASLAEQAEQNSAHGKAELGLIRLELPSGRAQTVITGKGFRPIGSRFAGDNAVEVMGADKRSRVMWSSNRWSVRPVPSTKTTPSLTLHVSQDFNTLPQIAAGIGSSAKQNILPLNPDFSPTRIQNVERFEWSDSYGRRFEGGLILPTGSAKGSRLPLVIQTYANFDEQRAKFWLDHPYWHSGFAGRAFVDRGMAVLQLDCEPYDQFSRSNDYRESKSFNTCLHGAVKELSRRGIIDEARVGLLGFSHSALLTLEAVTFAEFPIAAAMLMDGVQNTPFSYSMAYSAFDSDTMAAFDDPLRGKDNNAAFIGTRLFGDGVKTWIERSPAFHLDRIRTPLRFEDHGMLGSATEPLIPGSWDTYSNLRRNQRPAEYLILPLSPHALQLPYERFASQQGSVDWFSFWLRGQVRTEPQPGTPETRESLAAQYDRWKELRREHEAHLAELRAKGETIAPLPDLHVVNWDGTPVQ